MELSNLSGSLIMVPGCCLFPLSSFLGSPPHRLLGGRADHRPHAQWAQGIPHLETGELFEGCINGTSLFSRSRFVSTPVLCGFVRSASVAPNLWEATTGFSSPSLSAGLFQCHGRQRPSRRSQGCTQCRRPYRGTLDPSWCVPQCLCPRLIGNTSQGNTGGCHGTDPRLAQSFIISSPTC